MTLDEALRDWYARTPKMTHEEVSKHGAYRAGWEAREPEVKALRDALERVTDRMDRQGGDRDGMPECPWCRAQDDGSPELGPYHEPNCELVAARAALAAPEKVTI